MGELELGIVGSGVAREGGKEEVFLLSVFSFQQVL